MINCAKNTITICANEDRFNVWVVLLIKVINLIFEGSKNSLIYQASNLLKDGLDQEKNNNTM